MLKSITLHPGPRRTRMNNRLCLWWICSLPHIEMFLFCSHPPEPKGHCSEPLLKKTSSSPQNMQKVVIKIHSNAAMLSSLCWPVQIHKSWRGVAGYKMLGKNLPKRPRPTILPIHHPERSFHSLFVAGRAGMKTCNHPKGFALVHKAFFFRCCLCENKW